jgi:hypothetical protein
MTHRATAFQDENSKWHLRYASLCSVQSPEDPGEQTKGPEFWEQEPGKHLRSDRWPHLSEPGGTDKS